jgi:single-strand DNA-binding protein
MNETHVSFTGWVGTEVNVAETGNGQTVATFRVGSTPRRLVAGVWQDGPTNWFTVKAWRNLALNVQQSIRSGDAVVVNGRLVADVWEKDPGVTSIRYIVVATSIGHDLNKGTASFVKSARSQNVPTPDTTVQAAIHSYDEGGPNLDGNGEEIPAAETPAEEVVESSAA